MVLGLFIAYKGLYYMFTVSNFQTLPYEMNPLVDLMLFHVVTFFHLVGGVFIALGFRTRVMVLAQLPILLSALLLTGSPSRLVVWSPGIEFIVSAIVLIALVVFLIYGSGKMSVDAMPRQKGELK